MTSERPTPDIPEAPRPLSAALEQAMTGDRPRFRRQLQRIRERQKRRQPVDRLLNKLNADIQASINLAARRRARIPQIQYPPDLPIAGRREDIARAIAENQVVVIAGETGSGKTTQLPKICLELGRGTAGLIGHTQPRRLAARSVAARIAEELDCGLGDLVGYQVRFSDQTGEHTSVKLMTDGILLAEIQRDRYLSRYDTLIIDEAHERSLNIDFLLGYLKKILPRRPDLKLIITSATIDVERFSKHFDDAPIIEVSGRTYPVEVLYRPVAEADDDPYQAIVSAVDEILALPQRGDILVFLSGEREIREAANLLRKALSPALRARQPEILPLYARLSAKEQHRIFEPHRGIRIILATNVAETSITVPGIRYVIDTGYARISRYSYRTKVQRLPVEPVSQASANQRAGRCGRLADGVCIRLYGEEDFNNRPHFTDPEIVRTNLAAVILKMQEMRIGDVRDFPFVDAPDRRLINDGFNLLGELQALDDKGELTDIGRKLSRFPLDPRLGRALLAAEREGCLREALVVVCALSIQDPRERPADKRQAADEKHRVWQDPASDFMTLLNIWCHFEEQRQELSRNQFARYCHKHFISYLRMREWRDLHHQLHLQCRELKLLENRQPGSPDGLHRSLLAGMLGQIGFRAEAREYEGARNRKFAIFPGSGVAKKPPKWIVAAELLETSRLFAHQVAAIDQRWLPELAAHLVHKSYSEPHYDPRRGQVMAYEKQTLYGLVILERNKVPFVHIDPVQAREIFIQSALVENRYRGKGDFARHNARLIREIHDLEDRVRRRDILADDRELCRFFDERVPGDIANLSRFERWRGEVERKNPKLLYLTRDILVSASPGGDVEAQFPKEIQWQGQSFAISYRFEPGHEEDGVSVTIPVPVLHQVPEWRFDWLVPGLLREKAVALIKTLPKQLRKQFVPVPDYADRCLAGIKPENCPLTDVLGERLAQLSGISIAQGDWRETELASYYRANYRLVDEEGKLLAQSRDLGKLKARYRSRVQETLKRHPQAVSLERAGLTRWDFGDLAEVAHIQRGELNITAYPALVDRGDSVDLVLKDNPGEALNLSVAGVVRLFMLDDRQTVRYLEKQLFSGAELAIAGAGFNGRKDLVKDMVFAAFKHAGMEEGDIPRDRAGFERLIQSGKSQVVAAARELEEMLSGLFPEVKQLREQLEVVEKVSPVSAADIREQLKDLFVEGFLSRVPMFWLRQYPRYIRGVGMRLDKLGGQIERDIASCQELEEYRTRYRQLLEEIAGMPLELQEELYRYRFMVEEYRVSLFAQQLKTALPVSVKRLDRQWRKLQSDGHS